MTRHFTKDAPIRTRDDSTMKTKIASFSGQQFTAEREDDELVIYMLTSDPIDEVITQDRRPAKNRFQALDRQQESGLHAMNQRNKKAFAA
jgi:uncharacterized protein YcbX